MSKFLKLLLILLFSFSFNCAERTVIIERPSPYPPPAPAKNTGQAVASQKHLANGKKFYNRGKYAKALQEFKKAVIADSQNWEAHYYVGLCYQKLGHYRESVPEFEICIKVEIKDQHFLSKIRFGLAYSLEKTGDLQESEIQYKLAYTLDPDNKDAYKGVERVKEKRAKTSKIKISEK